MAVQLKYLVSFRYLRESPFTRNVMVLMSGTVFAQLLLIATAPILTRLYTPSDYGVLGIFLAIVGIVSNVAALRYEQAVILAKVEEDAVNILILATGIMLGLVVIVVLFLALGGQWLVAVLNAPGLAQSLWMVPFYILGFGSFQILNYWSTRNGRFKRLSIARISRSAGVVVTQLGAGLARLGSGGLLLGQVLGQSVALMILGWQILREEGRCLYRGVSSVRMVEMARRYRDFPLYSTPQNLINSISQAVPGLLFSSLFGPAVVGYYWFTYRLLLQPSELLAQSVRQVFFPQASVVFNAGGDVYPLLRKATLGLALIGLVPMATVAVGGPTLFAKVFGPEWAVAGGYARWIVLWWYCSFINPPSVMLIPVYNLQKMHALYELTTFLARVGAVLLGARLAGPQTAIALFSIVGVLCNIWLVSYMLSASRQRRGAFSALSAEPELQDHLMEVRG